MGTGTLPEHHPLNLFLHRNIIAVEYIYSHVHVEVPNYHVPFLHQK